MTDRPPPCDRGAHPADEGSAAVEFVLLTAVFLIPLVYLILAVFWIQGASFAAAGSARDAGRIVAAQGGHAAISQAERNALLAFDDFSLHVTPDVSVTCEVPGCDEPGSLVHVTVTAEVPLPLLPDFAAQVARIPVSAHATVVVDRYRERR